MAVCVATLVFFLLSGVSKVYLNKLYFVALVEEYLMVKSRDNREKKETCLERTNRRVKTSVGDYVKMEERIIKSMKLFLFVSLLCLPNAQICDGDFSSFDS